MSRPGRYEWRYIPAGRVAHALRKATDAGAICGVTLIPSSDWRGTGSQREYERAASLPTCGRCLVKAQPFPAARPSLDISERWYPR